VGVCRAEAGTCGCGCGWEEVGSGSGMNKLEDRTINFVCDWSFWNWLQNRFLVVAHVGGMIQGVRDGVMARSATGQVTSCHVVWTQPSDETKWW